MSLRSRREFLTHSLSGLGGIALATLLAEEGAIQTAVADSLPPRTLHFKPRAKSVIWLHMEGAASHLDLFDYKPELEKLAGQPLPKSFQNFNSTTDGGVGVIMPPIAKFQRRGASGHWVSDLYPKIAEHADELTMIHGCNVLGTTHPVSLFHLNTGAIAAGRPSLGSWLLYGLGTANRNLPAFVVLTDERDVLGGSANWAAGFLPGEYQGTRLRREGSPILHLDRPSVIGADQQRKTLDFLGQVNENHVHNLLGAEELEARIQSYELAYRMQTAAPEAVDLSKESEETKKLYGIGDEATDKIGTNILLARRLVERGVRFVQVYCGSGSAWDAHQDIVGNHGKWTHKTDKPIAALLTDLKARGLLQDTLVVWGREFGRTPFSQKGQGRDHNPWGFTMWFAGGGSKPGAVIGSTDEIGMHAQTVRMDPHDIHATIMCMMGLDHLRVTYPHNGRDERATVNGGRVVKEIFA